ncbi:TadE/TadG family type IV pilus assembly protein [Qipengyuania sp. CAU 1752]
MFKIMNSLAVDTRGTSVVEFALVAPFMLALFCGMVDLSLGFSTKVKTQQAAARAIEFATQAGANDTNRDAMASQAAVAASVQRAQVRTNLWMECSGVKQFTYEDVCLEGQETARYAAVEVDNFYRPMFAPVLGSKYKVINFTGRSTVRLQ